MTSIKAVIQDRYEQAAQRARAVGGGCCASTCRPPYAAADLAALPAGAVAASMGCGNPAFIAELRPGETVLDLGSGGAIDVLLAAKCVGPGGKVFGLDMTGEMLTLALENQRTAGVVNAEFLEGDIEAIPLPDSAVDVVISNCVINLSRDKDQVFRDIFRVLRPGGRLAVSDVLARGPLPEEIRASPDAWAACVAGAIEESAYRAGLERAGFTEIVVSPGRPEDASDCGPTVSAYIWAAKPRSC